MSRSESFSPNNMNRTAFVTSFPSRTSSGVSSWPSGSTSKSVCTFRRKGGVARRPYATWAMALPDTNDEQPSPEDDAALEAERSRMIAMRARLEGLFGQVDNDRESSGGDEFDGLALRSAIVKRWGVQYDIQPTKFHGRVYVQIMWRYFEQQSFYMDEGEYTSHCEAMAILLKRWEAVDYFLDYISNIKKRPVVGITINIPIPGLNADETAFEV